MKHFSAIAQTFILTSFSALSLFAISPVQAASFTGLGFLDTNNRYSFATGVSVDGSVIVGRSRGSYWYETFRWTEETGMVGLAFLFDNYGAGVSADGAVVVFTSSTPYGRTEAARWTQSSGTVGLGFLSDMRDYNSFATVVSADGSVVVGGRYHLNTPPISLFRWTEETGMVVLDTHLDDWFTWIVRANSVSTDGSVIVGNLDGGYRSQPFRWTESGGVVGLGDLSGGDFSITANAASADGSVIVGTSSGSNGYEAFRWTESDGMVGLGDLPGGGFDSKASKVSADGSVIVGSSLSVDGDEAFRWTESGGMVGLGDLPGGDFSSSASAVSADGSVIVGSSLSVDGDETFRWTESDGMVSLKKTLIGAGLDLTGWTLSSAISVSADGFTIVGNGINPSGQSEGWVANLSPEPIPEPLTILGSMAAIAFAAGFERKFSENKSDEKDSDA